MKKSIVSIIFNRISFTKFILVHSDGTFEIVWNI